MYLQVINKEHVKFYTSNDYYKKVQTRRSKTYNTVSCLNWIEYIQNYDFVFERRSNTSSKMGILRNKELDYTASQLQYYIMDETFALLSDLS